MIEKSCSQFVDVLASSEPVPGGGGAAALCGAMGAALASMVCNLTLGKKKYADVQGDIERIIKDATVYKDQLLQLVEKDAELFEPLSRAYGLPRNTPEEIAQRDKIMEEALRTACQAPYEMVETSVKCLKLLDELAEKGSRLAVSDVGVGAAMAEGAIKGACLNIYINTDLMKDRAYAEELNQKTIAMVRQGVDYAREIYDKVERIFLK